MTGDPSSWRPSGDSCTLPVDTAKVWKRLTELTSLTWPTLGEQVERNVLLAWLNPATSQVIIDTQVFDAACNVHRIDPRSGEEFLRPVYAAANFAWQNIQRLADGQELEVPRPELSDDDFDAWRDKREEQARSWLDTVLHELDMLAATHANAIYDFRLPEWTQGTTLASTLRHEFMNEVFAGPMAIGVSLYREPFDGVAFGHRLGVVYAMESLAFAVKQAAAMLNEADPNDEEAFETAQARVAIFWELLKGYTWAGTYQDSRLVSHLSTYTFIWRSAKEALVIGLEALRAARTDNTHLPLGGRRNDRFDAAFTTPIETVIGKMDAYIKASLQGREALRRMR